MPTKVQWRLAKGPSLAWVKFVILRLLLLPNFTDRLCCVIAITVFCSECGWAQTNKIEKVGDFSGSGTVVEILPGEITIADTNGKRQSYFIQDADERAISLDGNDYIISLPASIEVFGSLPADLLERGMYTRFIGSLNRFGKSNQPLAKLQAIEANVDQLAIEPESAPTKDRFVECHVIGRVIYCHRGNLCLEVPKSAFAPTAKIIFEIADSATFDINSQDLNRVRKGDKVIAYNGIQMSNGARVISNIKIELTAPREKATVCYSDQLYQKFSQYSDEPGQPRTIRSAHFILHTDISDRSAQVLLAKLENMYELVYRYYNRRPRSLIECYVVRDLNSFSGRLNPQGVAKIREDAGVTISQGVSLVRNNRIKGNSKVAVVYSCPDQGVVQHEAVHAYCAMAFGSTGPVWYAEGMAEIGQYWKPDNLAVEIDPVVIEYLTSAEKKQMADIVAEGQITGDSWKAYAWRWALCYLLANNPNYSRRFKHLGANMMAGNDDSFDKAFGEESDRISFEYDQFIENFDNGYRADLCAWDWSVEATKLTDSKPVNLLVNAQRGWHPTPVQVVAGQKYDVIAQGNWRLSQDGPQIDADGQPSRRGKLVGTVLHNYKLSEPFELGSNFSFVAVDDGQLYVRCLDDWNSIADNSGEIKVYIRRSPAK